MGVNAEDPTQWIGIFPNPAYETATLTFSENFIGGNFEVRDIEGRIIMNNSITSSKVAVNMEAVESGMYFVKAINGSQTLVVKLVVN